MFLVIEGIDGAGTTTQAHRLATSLRGHGYKAHYTREPSDGPIGKLLRQILTGEHSPTNATTLGLLFAADRADHIQREIEPALQSNEVVISDRYYHSSLAYQGTDEDRTWISSLNQRARVPDLTFFLEVDPQVSADRRHLDGREEELFDALETQIRVAAGYRQVVKSREGIERIESIDGHLSLDEISEILLAKSLTILKGDGHQ